MRIARRPLHRRGYRVASRVVGALHPPLARALGHVAGRVDGGLLVDPFCGTGTIAIEAALDRPRRIAIGSDLDVGAIAVSRRNCAVAGVAAGFVVADARRLPIPSGSVDQIVTNPPCGRRVPSTGGLERELERFGREADRVLRPGGRAVLLTPRTAIALPRSVRLTFGHRIPVRVAGVLVDIVVLVRTDA